jgi:hypothetical protein
MELEFIDLALILETTEIELGVDLSEEELFLKVQPILIDLLQNESTPLVHFGPAPDNTADGQDELLEEGFFFRIICNEKYLGIDILSDKQDVYAAFLNLIENYKPFWTTVIVERGFIKTETTIELLYRDVF